MSATVAPSPPHARARAAGREPSSALYEGWVRHRRFEPIEHEFSYPVFMTYLDLAELPEVLDRYRGWSARGPALARFRRADYIGPADQPLEQAVADAVRERGGRDPEGPIRLLTNLRYLGVGFNPVSFYFCMDRGGERVESVLAEVTNTPWGERHSYLIEREAGGDSRVLRGELVKAFHVSPLMDMEHRYDWRTTEPGQDLQTHIESSKDGRRVFDATLSLRRRELTPATMRRVLLRYPAATATTTARIYWQALRLKLKGARYFPHPGRGGGRR